MISFALCTLQSTRFWISYIYWIPTSHAGPGVSCRVQRARPACVSSEGRWTSSRCVPFRSMPSQLCGGGILERSARDRLRHQRYGCKSSGTWRQQGCLRRMLPPDKLPLQTDCPAAAKGGSLAATDRPSGHRILQDFALLGGEAHPGTLILLRDQTLSPRRIFNADTHTICVVTRLVSTTSALSGNLVSCPGHHPSKHLVDDRNDGALKRLGQSRPAIDRCF